MGPDAGILVTSRQVTTAGEDGFSTGSPVRLCFPTVRVFGQV